MQKSIYVIAAVVMCPVMAWASVRTRDLTDEEKDLERRNRAIHVHGLELRSHGYSGDSSDELITVYRTAEDRDYLLRESCLVCLAYKYEPDALPILREALEDISITVRMTAARLLGELGDTSGIARMADDYTHYVESTRRIERGEVSEVAVHLDPFPRGQVRSVGRAYMLLRALELGAVLARLGDTRVRDLAVETMAKEDSSAGGSINLRRVAIAAFRAVAERAKEEGDTSYDFAAAYARMLEAERVSQPNWWDLISAITATLTDEEIALLREKILADQEYSEEFHRYADYALGKRLKIQRGH